MSDPTFILPEEYFSNIEIGYSWIPAGCTDKWSDIMSVDHPGFDRLRTWLSDNGYIDKVTKCWNSDTVIKRFVLNNHTFKPGDRFLCAAAIGNQIKKNSA